MSRTIMNTIDNSFPRYWGALVTTTNTASKTSLVVVLLFIYFIDSFFYELSSDYSVRGQIGNAEVMVYITYICLNCQMQVNFLGNEFLGTECKF